MPSVSLVLCGLGGVGRCLLQQITATRSKLGARGVTVDVVAVLDSSGGVLAPAGAALDDATLEALVKHKAGGSSLAAFPTLDKVKDVAEAVAAAAGRPGAKVVADCSASELSGELVAAVDKGFKVALANKKPLTASQAHFDALTANPAAGRFESTVGAGVPMVAAMSRLMGSGDVPSRVQGCFSGTLGYVMTGIQNGTPFSEVVRTAKKLGYTEPDPRDDLGGVDVARKALILARFMGWKLEMTDVAVEPLFSADMANLSVDDFLAKLDSLDAKYRADVDAAKAKGEALRYVASLQDGKCVVGLKSVPTGSPIGALAGTANMVEFVSPWYVESNPLVIQGPGAGGDQTAAGVLSDIFELAFTA